MKKLYTIVFALSFFWSFGAMAQKDTINVLFVGNSFTYFYNLPQVLSAMAESQGKIIVTRQSTIGGSTLEQHWKEEKGTQTRKKMTERKWDYVVFNNHSLATISDPRGFLKYSAKFAELTRDHGAIPLFMMTWAYADNPAMINEISKMYSKLGSEARVEIIPCGLLFDKVRKSYQHLDLFFDNKHPSYVGTYLLGLSFYSYFTKDSCSDIPKRLWTYDRDGEKTYLIFMLEEDAAVLRKAVDEFGF